jgi:hypothetical protein
MLFHFFLVACLFSKSYTFLTMPKKESTLGQACCLIRNLEPSKANQDTLKDEFAKGKDMVCYLKEVGQYRPIIMDRSKVAMSPHLYGTHGDEEAEIVKVENQDEYGMFCC